MGSLRNGVYKLINEIAREAWKDVETESLRHEVRKANKGLRHLRAQANKWEREANEYYNEYWNLRHKCCITYEEKHAMNEIVNYLIRQQRPMYYANLLVKLQRRFDDISNGR